MNEATPASQKAGGTKALSPWPLTAALAALVLAFYSTGFQQQQRPVQPCSTTRSTLNTGLFSNQAHKSVREGSEVSPATVKGNVNHAARPRRPLPLDPRHRSGNP